MTRWIGPLSLAVRLVAFGAVCPGIPALATASSADVGNAMTGDAAAVSAVPPSDTFDVQVDLQGLYDEISQVDVPFMTQSDVDLFHNLLYTPDWVFVAATGQKQTWPEVRAQAIQASSAPPDSMIQRIQKLSLVPEGATTVVRVTTMRTIVDTEGRYGRRGASHTLTETTRYRDSWVKVSNEWTLKSRTQLSRPSVSVDKPEWGT